MAEFNIFSKILKFKLKNINFIV